MSAFDTNWRELNPLQWPSTRRLLRLWHIVDAHRGNKGLVRTMHDAGGWYWRLSGHYLPLLPDQDPELGGEG